jgi:hypothetical protein
MHLARDKKKERKRVRSLRVRSLHVRSLRVRRWLAVAACMHLAGKKKGKQER